jgi:hypothetical protein
MGREYRLNGVGYVNGREHMDAYFDDYETQKFFQFMEYMGARRIQHSQVCYTQVLSGLMENDALIKAGTTRKIVPGWYTVKYHIFLHPIHVIRVKRNRYGQFFYRFWSHQLPGF